MDVREMGWEDVDCIHVAQDREQWRALVNTVMKFWLPKKAENLTSRATISFSRRILLEGVS
jgi:hypothetical protein